MMPHRQIYSEKNFDNLNQTNHKLQSKELIHNSWTCDQWTFNQIKSNILFKEFYVHTNMRENYKFVLVSHLRNDLKIQMYYTD